MATGPTRLALPAEGRVWVRLGPATWVLRHAAPNPSPPTSSWRERVKAGWTGVRRALPIAAAGLPVAVLATVLGSTPAAMALGEKDMLS